MASKTNFLAWFAGSKVKDKDGMPLRLFHGTTHDFESFDPDCAKVIKMTGAEPRCFFFSNSPEVAQSYAGQRTPNTPTRLPTEELYAQWMDLLRACGPTGRSIDFHKKHEVENLKTYEEGGQVMAVYVSAKKILKVNARGDNWKNIWYKDDDWDTNHLISHARQLGHDGVCIKNVHDQGEGKGNPSDVYAFFRPEQIKSAFGNSGLYLKNSQSLSDCKEAALLKAAHLAKKLGQKQPVHAKRMLAVA